MTGDEETAPLRAPPQQRTPPGPPGGGKTPDGKTPGGKRSGALDALRPVRRRFSPSYSRFVRTMRLALPLAAAALVGLLLSWPRIEKTMETAPGAVAPPQAAAQNELLAPRFESADSENRPFTVTADRAVQSARDSDLVLLDRPRASIVMQGGARLSAEAEKGSYRQKEGQLLLQGRVRLVHDGGYAAETEKVLVSLKDRKAWADLPISGQGPAGALRASGFQADSGAGTLIFTGPARLVLNKSLGGL